ncbi:MAG: hypothetical protein ACE5JJ_05385 [Nitrospinota bacterium]
MAGEARGGRWGREVLFLLGLLALLAAALGVLISPAFRLARSALLLQALLQPGPSSLLYQLTEPPTRRGLSLSVAGEALRSDLYLPAGEGPHPGLLAIHGLTDRGKDDPNLARLAETLARGGWAVMVPEFPAMKALRAEAGEAKRVAAFFLALEKLQEVRRGSSGLLAFSFGAGPAFLAAARPEVRERVRYVVAFGAYYDPFNVIRFLTTGHYEFGGERFQGTPRREGKWFFVLFNLHTFDLGPWEQVVRAIVSRKLHDERAPIADLTRRLPPRGQKLLALVENSDPARFSSLLAEQPRQWLDRARALSMEGVLPRTRAKFFLIHGRLDPLVPHTESLRLQASAGDPERVSVTLVRFFKHVETRRPGTFLTLGADAGRLALVLYRILELAGE